MEIQKPKSHAPEIHDNTEKDLIIVPPSVLENKLQNFKEHSTARGSISSDIALAITILAAILTSNFKDFVNIPGKSIQGAFITGFIFMLVKIIYSLIKIRKTGRKDDIVGSLLNENKEMKK